MGSFSLIWLEKMLIVTLYLSALQTKPPNSGSLSFLSLGASKDEGLALALAAVNGATG